MCAALVSASSNSCSFVSMIQCFSALDPIKALFWAAVLNGVVAVPDDRDHADGNAKAGDGRVHLAKGALGARLAVHRGDDHSRGHHVRDLVSGDGGRNMSLNWFQPLPSS